MRRPRRGLAAAPLLALLAGVLTAPAAAADPTGTADASAARREASAAAAQVHRMRPAVRDAERAYAVAVDRLAVSATASIRADDRADAARAAHRAAQAARRDRIRSAYMSGGQAALVDGVLRSGPGELLDRLAAVQRVVGQGQERAERARADAGSVARAAALAAQEAAASGVTVTEVEQRSAELAALLDTASRRLDALSDRAAGLEQARAARAELAATKAAAEQALEVQALRARPRLAPADYAALYVAAAATCPGLPWQVLSAIGQVESGHGRNTSTSYAGAQGPMQFLPSTFAHYAVDGDGDGVADIQAPVDAVFTAARYLCANGGGSPAGLSGAIWHYNHAQWYVDMVLTIARQLSPADAAGLPPDATPQPPATVPSATPTASPPPTGGTASGTPAPVAPTATTPTATSPAAAATPTATTAPAAATPTTATTPTPATPSPSGPPSTAGTPAG